MTQRLLCHMLWGIALESRRMEQREHSMDAISLDAAVAMTSISKSTLWRRVTEGFIGKAGKDARNRAMLALADVLPLVDAPARLGDDELRLLRAADAGEAGAQADMGAMFYVAGNAKAALYWLNEAAAQGNADAMHWLAIAHASHTAHLAQAASSASGGGEGEIVAARERDDNLAVMWLAKAAAQGHALAQQQMALLKSPKR